MCLTDTVSSSALFGYIMVFGLAQHYFYRKYAIPIDREQLSCSFLCRCQMICTLLMPILAVIRLILQATVYNNRIVYGHMILSACFQTVAWPLSLTVILLERRNRLPSIPTRGHGMILLIFWTLALINEILAILNLQNEEWWFHHLTSLTDKLELTLFVLRCLFTLSLFTLGIKAPGIVQNVSMFSSLRFSREGLIESGSPTRERSTFANIVDKIKTIAPFVWPKKSFGLQLIVMFCMVTLVAGRVVNLMTPLYYKKIVDSLSSSNDGHKILYRWDFILTYVALWSLQGGGTGGSGVLNNLRSFFWIRVQQYTTREVQLYLFAHLHRLSLRWHLAKKTGEVLKVMDRGTSSANTLLSYIMFNVFPTIADIVIAIVYFVTAFNAWFGLILFVTMALYLGFTIWLTEWRTKFRRTMNLSENEAEAIGVDSLINFETVKYYAAEDYEIKRYGEAVVKFQTEEWKTLASLNLLNSVQNFFMAAGLVSGTLLCAKLIVDKEGLTVGDYVLFSAYTLQFYAPLNWFGTYYRMIQRAFIDMENMLTLLKEEEEIKDQVDAPMLEFQEGQVEMRNVSFSYTPEKRILKNVSFIVQPGKTLALVGPTGSGKSTIIRLLFRLYEPQEGEIIIDDQNICKVSQKSLRKVIGVVPQDTVLFNASIRFNIQYGNLAGFDTDVAASSMAAELHDAILTFPQGYDTVVGERGLKLSGGEKQRVAIARTIMKAPSLILLDEATSALDTQTERNIQASLDKMCANRTTVIVAHRLSTIIHAEQICVLKDGEIVERGTHEELLISQGLYYRMWNVQQKNEKKKSTSLDENLPEM